MATDVTLHLGDCRSVLPAVAAGSIDAVVCDPPYPHVPRSYGTWTEAEWWDLMRPVVAECRRVLRPTGSAVFILQPNSERVGRMRLWLWEFLVWAGREWGLVQDAYWWNTSTLPLAGANRLGLMRPSLKYAVWLGPPDCYRDQAAVLKPESANNRRDRRKQDFDRAPCPSRVRTATEGPRDDYRRLRTAAVSRGGTTPFNVLTAGSGQTRNGGTHGHPASTPRAVTDFWVQYLCPPGGTVLDPFLGSGTTGLSALKYGRRFVGVDRDPGYFETARARLADAAAALPLFA